MNIRLKLLSLTVAVGFASIAFSVWAKSIFTLPPPAECNRVQLSRWLVTRDVEFESPFLQVQLIGRIESELQAGWNVDTSSIPLTVTQQSRLKANISELKYRWFVTRCHEFVTMPNDQRDLFLDQQIAFVRQIQGLDRSPDSNSLFNEIDQWRARVPAEDCETVDCEKVDRVVGAAVLRWLQTDSIASLPPGEIATLADRIAMHLDEANDRRAAPLSASVSSEEAIWQANVDLLMKSWFQSQAEICDRLPHEDRLEFSIGVVKRLRGWDLGTILHRGLQSDESGNAFDAIGELASKIDSWVESSAEPEASRLREFQRQMQRAVVAELIRGGRALFR